MCSNFFAEHTSHALALTCSQNEWLEVKDCNSLSFLNCDVENYVLTFALVLRPCK